MILSAQDEVFLQRALNLADTSAAFASPNPTVGCVLALASTVIGEGAHRYDAFDHAEIVALKQAAANGHAAQGATAYVTLEPCSHHGRTAPCADALIAAGVARCVVATLDPNPQVSGRGIAKMESAGIDVSVLPPTHPFSSRARRLNDAFAFSIVHGRPFVTLKAALSVDGMLAPPPAARIGYRPHWLTGAAARADVQRLRHGADAIVTGIGTVLADNPMLTDRSGLPRRRPLLRVVLDTALRMPVNSAMVTSAEDDLLVMHGSAASCDSIAALRSQGVELIVSATRKIEPREVLEMLQARAVRSVLLESGSGLNAAFLREDLVDKVVLYFAESELGREAIPFAAGFPPYVLADRLTQRSRATFPHGTGEDVRLCGYLHDPWQS